MRGTRSIPSHKSENFLGRRQRCAANVGGNGVEPSFCAVGAMSALPPKADFPILELLPPPALRECHHRGLACRLVAVRRRAVTEGEASLQIFLYLRNLAFNSLASPSKSGNATESVMPRVRSSLSIHSRQRGSTA